MGTYTPVTSLGGRRSQSRWAAFDDLEGADDPGYRTARGAPHVPGRTTSQATPRYGGMACLIAGASSLAGLDGGFLRTAPGRGWPAGLARAVPGDRAELLLTTPPVPGDPGGVARRGRALCPSVRVRRPCRRARRTVPAAAAGVLALGAR